MDHDIYGLTEEEALARREQGQANVVQFQTGRTYLQILRKNAFTFINCVLFAISLVLMLMGQYGAALVTAGLVLLNVLVGVYQEGRAKRKLEQIALLTRPKARVVRGGQERTVDPSEIVLGDVLSGDSRPTLLALGMLVLFGVIIAVPSLRNFFELTLLRGLDYLLIDGAVLVWALVLRVIWRTRLVEWLLRMEVGTGPRIAGE